MSRTVGFRVLPISQTASLKLLTSTGLLKSVATTLDLDDLVEKTRVQCSVQSSSVMIAASTLGRDDGEKL